MGAQVADDAPVVVERTDAPEKKEAVLELLSREDPVTKIALGYGISEWPSIDYYLMSCASAAR